MSATPQTPSTPGAQTLAQLVGGILGGGIRVVDLTVPLEPATPTIQLPPQFAPSNPFSLRRSRATMSAARAGTGTILPAVSTPARTSMPRFTG